MLYGSPDIFISQSFGELSFNENGVHSQRNASIVSDGSHGQARITRKSTMSNSNLAQQPEIEASDVCILLVIPEKVYMAELFARHAAKHQTKDKISFLKESILFKHWTMDQLVKMAYAMKKKQFDPGAEVVKQGERVEYCWLIKEGAVRISHRVNATKGRKTRGHSSYVDVRDGAPEQSITVDIADLRANDCIGLVESMDEQTRKSQRDAVTLCSAELYFLPMSFFRSMISQDATTSALIEKVVQRRKKWEFIRREYALKFPTMSMTLPKGATSLSHYAIRGNDVSAAPKSRKKRDANNDVDSTTSENDDGSNGSRGNTMRKNRENALDSLVRNAGLLII
jgi:CRP-like cAMP-binding protein